MWQKIRINAAVIGASAYLAFFAFVFLKRVIWSVGDETDVLIPAVAALPWGALALAFPGGRNAAFAFVFLLGALNAISIYWILRFALRAWQSDR